MFMAYILRQTILWTINKALKKNLKVFLDYIGNDTKYVSDNVRLNVEIINRKIAG